MSSAKRQQVSKRAVLTDPVCLLAFGGGLGLAPVAPGTFGTLAGLPLYLLFANLDAASYGLGVLVLFLVGIPLCASAERRLGIQDHSGIVWDEIVGLLITLWGAEPTWLNLALGFALFRLFDAAKPWPIRWFDRRVHGGFGIMLDDAIAGALACAILRLTSPWL